jgi:hypothetical protein
MTIEFQEFEKISRLNREVIVTEKIDGTNGQVTIVRAEADGNPPNWDRTAVASANGVLYDIYAGSRSKWITPNADNHGFARWVYEHADELVQLGEGSHFGEWWGSGIQRKYGLSEKRWSLFNVGRWKDPGDQLAPPDAVTVPLCCNVVPILTRGVGLSSCVEEALRMLRSQGSFAAPGFMKPEGIVAFHTHARTLFKVTLERDEEPKSLRKTA